MLANVRPRVQFLTPIEKSEVRACDPSPGEAETARQLHGELQAQSDRLKT